jgi:hypothetical protein
MKHSPYHSVTESCPFASATAPIVTPITGVDLESQPRSQTMNSLGPRNRIPIPSFGLATTTNLGSQPKACVRPSEQTAQPWQRDTNSTVAASDSWRSQSILCLDRYIVLALKQRRTNRLTLDECFVLASNALAHLRSNSTSDSNIAEGATQGLAISGDLDGLKEEERFIYDLLVAVSPEVYRAARYPCKGNQSGAVECVECRAVWYLEAVAFDSDTQRLRELTKLLQQEPIKKDRADFAWKVIQGNRGSSRNRNPTSPSIRSSAGARTIPLKGPSTLDALLGAGMTLEERVRARAAIVKRQDDASKLSTANDNGQAAMLVRLADVLWAYTNTLRTRRLHKTEAPLQSCRVQLQDLVAVLQASLVQRGTKSSKQASMHACKGEKVAKRQIVEALATLQTRFPNWIVMAAKENPLAKDSMVRINAIGYAEIRQELLRPPSCDDHASARVSSARKHGVNSILQPLQPSDAKRRKKAFYETTIDR